VLDPDLQDKAFNIAAQEISDRIATMFAKKLVKQLKIVIEQDGEGDDNRRAQGESGNTAAHGEPEPEFVRFAQCLTKLQNMLTLCDSSSSKLHNIKEIYNYLSGFIRKNLGLFEFDKNKIKRLVAKVTAEDTKI
jgi:hypothetical protein